MPLVIDRIMRIKIVITNVVCVCVCVCVCGGILQQFGILLASYVAQQYPLPEAYSIVDNILQRLLVLTNGLLSELREDYFLPLLPAIVRFCQTFPPLCSKATSILVALYQVCGSDNGGVMERRAGRRETELQKLGEHLSLTVKLKNPSLFFCSLLPSFSLSPPFITLYCTFWDEIITLYCTFWDESQYATLTH